jgi:hypothetical protein
VGSWEARLEPQVRKVSEHVPGGAIPGPAPIDTIARDVAVRDEEQFLAAG